jgi:GNAT superfamily N-acetyltransferase
LVKWGLSLRAALFFFALASMSDSMTLTLALRVARTADLTAVDGLLQRCYPRLLAGDYPPSVMVLALPIITRARPDLLASGRYFLALGAAGGLLGAGGWSVGAPGPSGQPKAADKPARIGHVRHFATDPAAVRQGVGRAVMAEVFRDAKAAGITTMECLSTRTAVPFYTNLGFEVMGPVDVLLRAGIVFPAVRMRLHFT